MPHKDPVVRKAYLSAYWTKRRSDRRREAGLPSLPLSGRRDRPEVALLERVVKSGDCWVVKTASGEVKDRHAVIQIGNNCVGAHRLSYQLFCGPIPPGMYVCHTCDVKPCVNPTHLFVGTHRDNVDDMVRKGRQARGDGHGSRLHPERVARGENQGLSKLDWNSVREIRRLRTAGWTYRELAERFGVDYTNIGHIVTGKTWRE